MKPQGRFYAEEVFGRLINGFPWRHLAKHPSEDRFDVAGFDDGLIGAGFDMKNCASLAGCAGWFVAEKKDRSRQSAQPGDSLSRR